jgi:hypothetical protein
MSAIEPRTGLKAGDLAGYDTIRSGIIPLKVLDVERDGDDYRIRARVTGSRYAYDRGSVLTLRPSVFLFKRERSS